MSMFKKRSLLWLLGLCSGCTSSEIERVQSQPVSKLPLLTTVMQAQTVEIHNDWNGYSDVTPILRHYKLRRERQELIGNAHVAVGGYGAAGIRQQQTKRVKIPAAQTAKFLAILAKTPLQVGKYQPQMERSDDYPFVKIQIEMERKQIIFSSQSQSIDRSPWKVTILVPRGYANGQNNPTTEYISSSALPTQALQVLSPYLDLPGIDHIIERRRPKQVKPK
jgi:hypothetical protein